MSSENPFGGSSALGLSRLGVVLVRGSILSIAHVEIHYTAGSTGFNYPFLWQL